MTVPETRPATSCGCCRTTSTATRRPAALAAVVREVAPDVVIVQEAPRRFRWRQKCAALAGSFGLVVAAGGLPSLGNLMLTSLRVRVHDDLVVQYPLTPGRHLRGAEFVRCAVGPDRGSWWPARTCPPTRPSGRGQAALFKKHLAEAR